MRYEETEETVDRLYAGLGLHGTEEMRRAQLSHTEASPSEDMSHGGTYRSAASHLIAVSKSSLQDSCMQLKPSI